MNLGKMFKKSRLKEELSQGDVSKSLGYTSPQYLSNVERNISTPSPLMLKRMCDLYGIDYKISATAVIDNIVERNKNNLLKKYRVSK